MADSRDDDTTVLARSGLYQVSPEAGQPRAHYLFIVDGEGQGRRIPLGREPLVIGRAPPAEVVLQDQRISRSHCRVVCAFDEVIVVDLESSNGTFIDGKKITTGTTLPVGSRLQLGSHVIEHEWRIRKEVEESQELDRDIQQASNYIQALLPPPLTQGPIRSDWALVPCARLGGDTFGYRFLDPGHFAIYLIDVSGHGAGAAMHAVSVINVLRQGALPATDHRDPASVLTALNAMFGMETHGDLYLTMWYGVYDLTARTIAYGCAGHHAAYLVGPPRDAAVPLGTKNRAIGISPTSTYMAGSLAVPPGSMLYVFSDGVFEVQAKDGGDWDFEAFLNVLKAPPVPEMSESQRLLQAVRETAGATELEDDFSLVTFRFPPDAPTRTADATWPDRPRPA